MPEFANRIARSLSAKLGEQPSALDFIPEAQHAAVRAGIATINLTTAIQNGLNAVASAGGGVLYLPWGVYPVTDLTVPGNVFLQGDGSARTILKRIGNLPAGRGVLNFAGSKSGCGELAIDGQVTTFATALYSSLSDPSASLLIANSSIRIHPGTSDITLFRCRIFHTGGYAIHIDARTANVYRVEIIEPHLHDNRSFLFGATASSEIYGSWTGGILAQGDGLTSSYGVRGLTVRDGRFRRGTGNQVWSHLYGFGTLHTDFKIQGCTFEDIGRDGVMLGGVVGGDVAGNFFRRIGYICSDDVSAGIPRWINGQWAVGLDTAGLTRGVSYRGNSFVSCYGAAMDLDGFAEGVVSDNTVIVPTAGEPEYTEDGIASWAGNYCYGVQTSNSNNIADAAVGVRVTGNLFRNCGFGAIRMYASRRGTVSGNTIEHPAGATVAPIVLGNIGSGGNQRAYANTVTDNDIHYSPATITASVQEDPNGFAFSGSDINRVYGNRLYGTNTFEFRKAAGSGSRTAQEFASNKSGLATESKTTLQREDGYLRAYWTNGSLTKSALSLLDQVALSGGGSGGPLLNISLDAVGGVIATGARTSSAFDDAVLSSKVYADGFLALAATTFAVAEANLLADTVGLIRYNATTKAFEQSTSASAGARVWTSFEPSRWSVLGADIYRSSGRVTIGSSVPASLLTLRANTDDGLTVTNNTQTGVYFVSSYGGPTVGSTSSHPLVFLTGNAARGRITDAGNWLIGANTDDASGARLQIAGFARATVGFATPSTNTDAIQATVGGVTARFLIGTRSLTLVGDTAANSGVSGLGQGRIYFDSTANRLRISENGGAFQDLTGAGVSSLTGTANQVNVSAATGAVTLSLPQSIHSAASPTFTGANLAMATIGDHTSLSGSRQAFTSYSYGGAIIGGAAASTFYSLAIGGGNRNAGQAVGFLSFHGFGPNAALNSSLSARVSAICDTSGSTDYGAHIDLETIKSASVSGAASGVRMRITSYGNILVATTTDDTSGAKLQVAGFVSATGGYYAASSSYEALKALSGGVSVRSLHASAYSQLGSGSATPTATTGAAIGAGAIYWDTGVAGLRVYNGSTWNTLLTAGATPTFAGVVATVFNATATGATIAFQTNNSNFQVNGNGVVSSAGGYNAGGVNVIDASQNIYAATLQTTGAAAIGSTDLTAAQLFVRVASVQGLRVHNSATPSSSGGAGIQAAIESAPASGDRLAFYAFGVRSGGSNYNGANFTAFATQAWTLGTAQGTELRFETTPNGAASRSTRMTIGESGTVTIGSSVSIDQAGNLSASSVVSAAGVNVSGSAYNSLQVASGGVYAGLGATLDQGLYLKTFAGSPNSPGGGYGALSHRSGSTYLYWNGSAWATVDLSASLSGAVLTTTNQEVQGFKYFGGPSDRLVIYRSADNVLGIQTMLDGLTDPTTYSYGGTNNALVLQPRAGIVGIGAINGSYTLNVAGNLGVTGGVAVVASATNVGYSVTDGTITGLLFASGLGGIAVGSTSTVGGGHPLVFLTNNTDRGRITATGNWLLATATGQVAIGTATPATESANARLTVVGALSQSASTLATSNSNAGFTVRANASSGYQLAIGATSVDGSPYLQGLVFNGGSSASSLILQGYGGAVGIGTASPATNARLHVKGAGSALPAASGSTQSAGLIQRFNDSSTAHLDIGGAAGTGMWLQVSDDTNLAVPYQLFLQPTGGTVLINRTSNDSSGAALQLAGFVSATTGFATVSTAYDSIKTENGFLGKQLTVTSKANPGTSTAGNSVVYMDSTSNQLMASVNGGAFVNLLASGVASITGTANQVLASAPTGAVTLSLPQNIHNGATPTFAGVVATVFNSTATGATIAFQTNNSNFQVNGNGVVSSAGGYNAGGLNVIDASRNIYAATLQTSGNLLVNLSAVPAATGGNAPRMTVVGSTRTITGHGENKLLVLPAGNNGAASGDAGLYMWISEPGMTWTGAGIARNIYNTSNFPRVNSALTGQMIRFDEGTGIIFTSETSGGARYTPLTLTAANATIAGSLTTAAGVVTTVFNSTATGATIAFQTSNSNFSVDGNGNVSGVGSANMTAGFRVGGTTVIDSSRNASGLASVTASGVFQSQATSTSIAFQTTNFNFQVNGNGVVSSAGGINVSGVTCINTSRQFVGYGVDVSYFGISAGGYNVYGGYVGQTWNVSGSFTINGAFYSTLVFRGGILVSAW